MIDLYEFVRTNKKVLIWICFFGLLYLVRKVFGLVFLTFILCYIFNNVILWLERRTRLRRHLWTVVLYLFFVAAVAGLLFLALPHILGETKLFITKLPQSLDAVHLYLDRLAHRQPQIGFHS